MERAAVTHRKVFFLPGFDPAPPRAHRVRYRREGERQAAISGYRLTVDADPGRAPGAWTATGRFGAQVTQAEFEVLAWSDLVRAKMKQGIAATYRDLARTAWIYVASGALPRLMRLRKGPVIAALYPVVVLVLQALAAVAAAVIVAAQAHRLLPWAAAVPLGLAAGALVLWAFRRHDGRVLAHYLMTDYAYTAAGRGAYPPDLSARLRAFTARLETAMASDADEVLLVGHSSGAYLAVTVLADLLRGGRVPEGPALSLLTLGQVVPMASFLPRADRLRADLACLAASDRIAWVDVTAPGDGCAFALCDPVAVSGVAPPGKRWPLVISAAFSQTLKPETWARLRWRFFAAHFQYLCAFDRPGDYDYFAITAGPETLGQRFAGRAPSGSRIERPVNRHTSVAA
ncbi:hypothetical protein HKCCE2091_04815 [Rhodobacterales bacterium HKCCE2091]|nr:hypothetical protein [Rhodobacterales bacterium HKCCE2091]